MSQTPGHVTCLGVKHSTHAHTTHIFSACDSSHHVTSPFRMICKGSTLWFVILTHDKGYVNTFFYSDIQTDILNDILNDIPTDIPAPLHQSDILMLVRAH